MNESKATTDTSPSPSVIRRVEALCDEFEAALRRGASPDPQDYLVKVDAQDRPKLLFELEALVKVYYQLTTEKSSPCGQEPTATLPTDPTTSEPASLPA